MSKSIEEFQESILDALKRLEKDPESTPEGIQTVTLAACQMEIAVQLFRIADILEKIEQKL